MSFYRALETTQSVQTSTISQYYSDPKAHSSDDIHTAEQLAKDYLKALKSHLVSILERELGNLQATNTPLEFLITVPAVWSDLAKEKTLVAAEKAGLGDDAPIHMISEPVGVPDL
jgi:molecular chaperone DnaK (HSP70)